MSLYSPLRFFSLTTALWLLAAGTLGHAQEPSPEMTLRVTAADVEVLGKALDALPFNEAMNTIIKIQAQIDAQPGPQWAKYRSPTTVQEVLAPEVAR